MGQPHAHNTHHSNKSNSTMAKKVCVGSKNPVKMGAITAALAGMFPGEVFDVVGIDVESGVAAQPMGLAETLLGARNRIRNCKKAMDADLYCGLEGGCVLEDEKSMYCFAWIVVSERGGDGLEGRAMTASCYLPPAVAALVSSGVELGHANDRIFGTHNSKQSSGAVGILTDGLIDRTEFYEQAAVFALVPFKNRAIFCAAASS